MKNSLTIKASCTVFKSCIVSWFTSLQAALLKLVIFGSALLLKVIIGMDRYKIKQLSIATQNVSSRPLHQCNDF